MTAREIAELRHGAVMALMWDASPGHAKVVLQCLDEIEHLNEQLVDERARSLTDAELEAIVESESFNSRDVREYLQGIVAARRKTVESARSQSMIAPS